MSRQKEDGDLIDHFRNSGLGKKADSWVSTGQNEPVDETELGGALGPDLLDTLAKQTGLSRDELLKRLSAVLPQAVDHMTPEGRLPPRSRRQQLQRWGPLAQPRCPPAGPHSRWCTA